MALRFTVALTLVLWAGLAFAQTDANAQTLDMLVEIGPEILETGAEGAVAEPTWDGIASRAETLLRNGKGSLFALNRLRDQLVDWRVQFSSERKANAGRIETVRAQIAALGDAVEDEATELATRREALEEQLKSLLVPVRLAEESFARADGLIAEIDAQIRFADADNLTERGPALLTPDIWTGAGTGLLGSLRSVWSEASLRLERGFGSGEIWPRLPVALMILAIAWFLLSRGRQLAIEVVEGFATSDHRGRSVMVFLSSLLEIVIPYLGLLAVVQALKRLEILGTAGNVMLSACVTAGLMIFVARWLAARLFPSTGKGPLNYPFELNAGLRRSANALGLGLALLHVIEQVMRLADVASVQLAAAIFPVQLLLSIVLFRMGQRLRQPPETVDETTGSTGRVRRFIGSATMAIAVLAPVLAVAGFASASERLFEPTVFTLAIFGAVILLQRLVHDIWLMWSDPEAEQGALAPVLIGFALAVFSIPILALVWGARRSDLAEVWTRFQQGFSVGETQISPTDFIVFAVVFAIGYLVTRLTQSGLRNSVLPRTKLDQGGRDAVIAGVGYIGMILAAIIAINSAGVNLSNIALVAGALSVGIGFGLQTVVSNFVSGIILLIERPVSSGDWIEVNGQMGTVKEISVRSTRIETFDRTDVIIPNADLIAGQVTNWTRGNSIGRVIVPVGVAYGTDVEQVKDILLDVARSNEAVLTYPAPVVLFQNFGDNSLDFEIRAILRDVNKLLSVKSEMNTEIAKRFAEADIEIPFPQRDVWMRTPES